MSETDPEVDSRYDDRVRAALSTHPVSLALVFGSAIDDPESANDLDVAVEFENFRPGDPGYAEAFVRLRSDLNDTLPVEVDLVDVHSMGPRFAGSVLEDAELLVGSEQRRSELEATLETESPSLEDARQRVATAAERLREESS